VDVVTARDAAILQAVRLRPWTTDALMSVMPVEEGQTVEQRKTALKSALIRMRVKKQIDEVDGQWRAGR
jgi:hypothetical protein